MHESFFQRSSEVSLIVESLFLCESVEVKCLRTMRESIVGGKGGRMEARVDFFFCACEYLFYWSLVCGLKSSCVFPRFQSCCSSLHASTCSYIIIVCERELLGRGEPNLTFVAIPLPLAHCLCKERVQILTFLHRVLWYRGQLLDHHNMNKKNWGGPQFVKNRTQKWLFFAKKLPS